MYRINYKYIVILMMSLGFAIFSGGNLPYVLFYLTLLMGIFSLFCNWVIMKGLEIQLVFDKKNIVVGEEFNVILKVINNTIFPISYLKISSSFLKENIRKYNGEVTSVNVNSNKFLRRKITINKRGIIPAGIIEVQCVDLFGIIKNKTLYEIEDIVKIYPRIYELTHVSIKGGNYKDGVKGRYNGVNLDTIRDIREYHTGDSVKKIHWKITAKKGEIFIKNYESHEESLVNIFIDMREDSYYLDYDGLYEEAIIDFSLSFIKSILKYNISPCVYLCNDEFKQDKIQDENSYYTFVEYLLNHYSDGKGQLERYIEKAIIAINKKSALIIITNDLCEENKELLIKLSLVGYKVTVFYNEEVKVDYRNTIKILQDNGVECINISQLIDFKENR